MDPADTWSSGGRARAVVSSCHFRGAGRAHADPAHPRGRGHAPPDQCGHGLFAHGGDRARGLGCRAGETSRARRGAAPCAHRRAVFGHRRSPGSSGRRGCKRDARPRPRPAVLATDAVAHREFVNRRGCLRARTGPIRTRRKHRHRDRACARQTLVRPVARAVPSVPRGPGLYPGFAGDRAARQGSQCRRSGRDEGHPGLRQAVGRGARRHQRYRAASGDVPRRQSRRLDHQAARLQRRLSVYRAASRPAGAGAIAGDAGERRAVRRSVGATDRDSDRVRD